MQISPVVNVHSWFKSRSNGVIFCILFVIFFSVGLGLSFRSLSYGWFWDDLHLIRTFQLDEIGSAFTGSWDPWETPGYRPVTVIFNHVRACLFGENRVAHRIFVIALFASYLTIFSFAGNYLGAPYYCMLLAGLFTLCSRYNWFNLVWISDGIHVFTGFLTILSLLSLLLYLDKPATWKIISCCGFFMFALLAREDSLVMFPVIVAGGGVYCFLERD